MENFFELILNFAVPLLVVVSVIANIGKAAQRRQQQDQSRRPPTAGQTPPANPWAQMLGIPEAPPTPVYVPRSLGRVMTAPAPLAVEGEATEMMTGSGEGLSVENTAGSEGQSLEGSSTEGRPAPIQQERRSAQAAKSVRAHPATDGRPARIMPDEGFVDFFAHTPGSRAQRRSQPSMLSRKALVQGLIYSEILARPGGRRTSR